MKTIYLRHWKFSFDSGFEAWMPDFDDRAWQDVIVPHDWAVSLPFTKAASSGTGYLPGGTAWYRTVLPFPPEGAGKPVFISFDGVYKNSRVWCNGSYLGNRPSGYAGFRYDISHCILPGEDNVIAVKVSHEDIADSRWYTGSGIYRKVCVHYCDPVYIPPERLRLNYLQTPEGKITIRVSGELRNADAEAAEDIRISASLADRDGQVQRFGTAFSGLASHDCCPFELQAVVPHPRLWSPEEPNLYRLTLEAEAVLPEGRRSRFLSPPLAAGIRFIRFDPDHGFFCNGERRKLKGVCVHHDAGCLGAAVWPEVWLRRLAKLKRMGCNAIRMSHNPHMPELYDLCDELGFFVMEEAFDEWEGCKNKWTRGHNVYPPVHQGYYEDFPQWHERDLADMVIRGRNHPSIIMWSIGNEIDYPNDPYCHPLFTEMTGNNDANKPEKEMLYNSKKPNMERLAVIAAELAGIVRKYDDTRPVLSAAAFPELSSQIGFFDALDLVGYNYKEQLYEGDHRRFPRLPILGSENGHHFKAWKIARDTEYIGGQFLWTGIDYMGEARGWPVRGSAAGLLDLAGYEKTGYYRRKALWSGEPFLYMVTRLAEEDAKAPPEEPEAHTFFRSWNYPRGSPVELVCYTNLKRAEFFLNGKSLGAWERGEDRPYIFLKVPFERGTLVATGTLQGTEANGFGGEITDTLESVLPGVQICLRLPAPHTPAAGTEAEGENLRERFPEMPDDYRLRQVELVIFDEEDRFCSSESPMVNFTVEGPGRILGIENGDLSDCSEYAASRRRVYRGRLIIYLLIEGSAEEKTTLHAFAEGYRQGIIRV